MNNYLRTYKPKTASAKIPLISKILFFVATITVIFHILSALFSGLADFLNSNISSFLRFILTSISNPIPFSVIETAVILLPVIAFLLIKYGMSRSYSSFGDCLAYLGLLASILCLFYIMFFWTLGVGYCTESIDKKLGLEREAVSTQDLVQTANILAENANKESEKLTFRAKNFSVMPYNIQNLGEKLNCSYKSFINSGNGFVSSLKSNLKPVVLSQAMSYTHITGLYSYFTGEANINVDFPDYTIPYTAAHEMAHQRGISREDEANLVAFLVCIESEDPYIRYSAYMNMLEYVLNALYSADEKLYADVVKSLNSKIKYEMLSYGEFFKKYQNSTAGSISQAINNTHLIINGTEGTKSYGMVVDLAVAYYKQNDANK